MPSKRKASEDKHLYDFRAGVLIRLHPATGPVVESIKKRGIYVNPKTRRAYIKWGNKPLDVVEYKDDDKVSYSYIIEMSMEDYHALRLFRYSVPKGWRWDNQKHRLMRVLKR